MARGKHPLYDQEKSELNKAVDKKSTPVYPNSVTDSSIYTDGLMGGYSSGSVTYTTSGNVTTGNITIPASNYPNYVTYGPASGSGIPYTMTPSDPIPLQSPQDREHDIEFIEEVMWLLVSRLDECDVPNEGGTMDRSEYAPLESKIDLGEYEIVIKRKSS
jgi:hypothetical protein